MASPNEGWAARWQTLGQGARIALIGGAVLALTVVIWLAFQGLRERYGVLFSDLSQTDAAAIVEELKARKIPYRLQQGGGTIVVPEDQVHDVRLQLMSSELPLNGGVGFEIFDKQGLGATENAQRVSYQRALQGELSRTIGALEHVKAARVHLVLAESSLFSKDRREATAAVTLSLQPGATVERQQILGIQRLIAASVPGLVPERVVVTNHRGVTLSSGDEGGVGAGAADSRLEVKRRIEEYVTHKVARLLDSAYGPGQAIVTVDAALNFDASKKTIQDLVPLASARGAPEGMIVRRRQMQTGSTNDSLWNTTDGTSPAQASNSSVEVEYEYGKRMEEVIGAPGNVTRLSIGIIVPDGATEQSKQKIVDIVRAAAGVDEARGDVVSVQTLLDLGGSSATNAVEQTASDAEDEPAPALRAASDASAAPAEWALFAVAGVIVVLAFALLLAVRTSRTSRLSDADRERLLRELQRTLDESAGERSMGRT